MYKILSFNEDTIYRSEYSAYELGCPLWMTILSMSEELNLGNSQKNDENIIHAFVCGVDSPPPPQKK